MKLHDLRKQDIYNRIVTAVNISLGDSGFRAKEILKVFKQLCEMSKEKYEEERRNYE
jgi:hypothetical protein